MNNTSKFVVWGTLVLSVISLSVAAAAFHKANHRPMARLAAQRHAQVQKQDGDCCKNGCGKMNERPHAKPDAKKQGNPKRKP